MSRSNDVRLAAARAFDKAPASWRVRLHEKAPEESDVLVFGSDLGTEAGEEIVFDPAATDSIVDRINKELSRGRHRVYVVTGAGGGAGATSVALHLALVAAREHSTCYLDASPVWSSATRLGIEGKHLTWADLQSGGDSPGDVYPALPVAGGFRVLLPPQEFDLAAFEHALTWAQRDFERVIVDCSDPRDLKTLISRADAGVMVVPFSVPAAQRAARLIEQHPDIQWAVVLNRLGPGGELTTAALHRLLDCRSTLQLPCTPSLRDAEDDSRLLSSEWSRYVRRITRLLHAVETVRALGE